MHALKLANAVLFLSTLSLRRATCNLTQKRHPPHNFYPRSPCGERPVCAVARSPASRFLSTLSLRRATNIRSIRQGAASNFYPRSPCGERPIIQKITVLTVAFLSTLSLRRATKLIACHNGPLHDFYPRSPCGERPTDAINGCNPDFISIHALLAESDIHTCQYFFSNF